MDILSQLAVNTRKEFTINGVKMSLAPMGGEMVLALEGDSKGNELEVMYRMVQVTLSEVDSTVTLEGVKKLPMNVLMELIKAIKELNGLTEE